MKKLMIAAAIVCAAAFSQAATTKWSWTTGSTGVFKDGYVKAGGGTAAVLGDATLYLIKTTATDLATQNSIYQDLNSGATSIADIKASAISSYKTDSAGKITGDIQFSRTDAAAGTTYYYALFAATDDGKYVYFSKNTSGGAQDDPAVTPLTMASGTSSNFRTFDTVKSAGWYAVESVPEPTSGLLLLLGVAGLALRRRRA